MTEPLAASLKLELDEKAVSAYRLNGQRITGRIRISNPGAIPAPPIDASLEVVTSDFRWRVKTDKSQVNIPPGGNLDVPVEVLAPADAWADIPVRISARVFDDTGRQVETWQEIEVAREIPAVSPYLYFAIPEALRGGFNAAWVPFGGEWTPDTPKSIRIDAMRDNLVFPGAVVECCTDGDGWSDEERPLLTIDLPGDDPMPVRGIAINHFGSAWTFFDIRNANAAVVARRCHFRGGADLRGPASEKRSALCARFAGARPLRTPAHQRDIPGIKQQPAHHRGMESDPGARP